MRLLFLMLLSAFLMGIAAPAGAQLAGAAPGAPLLPGPDDIPWTPIPIQACCKTCSKGKACGDSCIARDRRCKKGRGCACDG